jgi:3-oxoacyl-[acyl-carrier-protein] synthase-3
MILLATVSADQVMPNTACVLQRKLGAGKIMAMDLSAACSGFVYGLAIADQFIKTGVYKNILVVGAEVLSRLVDYSDRETCILFGDGAGAAIVSRAPENQTGDIFSVHLHADGQLGDLFVLPGGGSVHPPSHEMIDQKLHFVRMKGREIFKHAVRTMSQCCQEALAANNASKDDIDWLIPHQANLRILDAVAKHFGISQDRIVINLDETANTSAATVPIALDEAIRDGRIQRGDKLMLAAFGAGLTSGSVYMQY